MWDYMKERVVREGKYIVDTNCTVRACAKVLGASKSTIHKDVTERLASIDPVLWEKVKVVLSVNLQERHLRGGDATKRKYENKKLSK